jgi:hypothetical protein
LNLAIALNHSLNTGQIRIPYGGLCTIVVCFVLSNLNSNSGTFFLCYLVCDEEVGGMDGYQIPKFVVDGITNYLLGNASTLQQDTRWR